VFFCEFHATITLEADRRLIERPCEPLSIIIQSVSWLIPLAGQRYHLLSGIAHIWFTQRDQDCVMISTSIEIEMQLITAAKLLV
jgi:hypothetical protein